MIFNKKTNFPIQINTNKVNNYFCAHKVVVENLFKVQCKNMRKYAKKYSKLKEKYLILKNKEQ